MWPKGALYLCARVVFALIAIAAATLIAILTPILQAWAVDDLAGSLVPDFILGAIGLTLAFGLARISTNAFQQLGDVIFAKVGQRAL